MNLELCFTDSMTTHSISILSELEMSSVGFSQARGRALHQSRYQPHSVEVLKAVPNVQQFPNVVN